MSALAFVSPVTRFVASDVYTTKRPFLLIEGSRLPPFACCAPVLSTGTVVHVVKAGLQLRR